MSRLILNKNQSLKFLFCLITFHLYSANSQNHKFHLNFALGAGLNKRYDSYQSKIVYSGISALGLIGLSHVHEKWHNHFWAAGFGGLMHNPNLETYTLYNFGFEAQLSIKRLASSSLLKHKWFIGLGNCTTSDISYHQSFQNNAWSWVSVSTIGIANRFEKSFQIKKEAFSWEWNLHLPVYAFAITPKFSPSITSNSSFENSWGFLGKHAIWQSTLGFSWLQKNNNRFGFSYQWRHSYTNAANIRQDAMHQFLLTMDVAL